jgi:ribosomal silencing factor RsfS
MEPIVNRVAESDIEVYNLEALWDGAPVVELDLEPFLVQGLVLREREFRAHVKAHDWSQYAGAHVAVFCSADAIVPVWAYMLVAAKLDGIARSVAYGRAEDLIRDHFTRALEAEDWSRYADRIVVVKGCGNRVVPANAFMVVTQKLQAVARKLMYGEPCSSVPLWRRPKAEAPGARPAAARPVAPPVVGRED